MRAIKARKLEEVEVELAEDVPEMDLGDNLAASTSTFSIEGHHVLLVNRGEGVGGPLPKGFRVVRSL